MDIVFTLNQNLFLAIFSLAGQNHLIDSLMIFGAEYLIFLVFAACLLALFFRDSGYKKAFLLTLVSGVVGFILLKLISVSITELRPFTVFGVTPLIPEVPGTHTFPSRHSLALSIIAFSYLRFNIKFAKWLLLMLLWMGFARIYVGVHYPLDILGGILVGFLSVTIGWNIKDYFVRKLK